MRGQMEIELEMERCKEKADKITEGQFHELTEAIYTSLMGRYWALRWVLQKED